MKSSRINCPPRWNKVVLQVLLLFVALFVAESVLAASGGSGSIGDVAKNIIKSLGSLARLITAAAYVAGFGFAVGAILKFKAHKDNPTQIPVGTPVALLFIAAALIFLPTIFGTAGVTLFGGSETPGGVKGVASFS